MRSTIMSIPRLYLGTMTFGWSQTSSKVDETVALDMVNRFIAHNEQHGEPFHRIDTARIYAGGNTESIVGLVLPQVQTMSQGSKLLVGTKAHPSRVGGLSRNGLESQLQASMIGLGAMEFGNLEEYYLHQPDPEHSLLESLQVMHELVSNGVVNQIGLSNFHVREVERAFALCAEHQWTPPSVYQGLYNPLNRAVESELLPLLQQNSCSFVAYNPLAAGLLAGKHHDLDKVQKGRFKDNPNYLPRFYTPANFEAVDLIRKACDEEGISMVEATYRWLLRHSALRETDGVLLGASSVKQLDENLEACTAAREKGPLSDETLKAFDEAWKITKDGAFPYWRSFSADMPNRETLDQGAAYEASKK